MIYNVKVNDKHFKNLLDIDGYHYSDIDGFSDEDLARILDLNIIFLSDYNNWYFIDDKFYYFKARNVFIELLANEIIKQYDLKYANKILVRKGNTLGVMSESFRKRPSKFYDYDDYFKHKGLKVPRTLTNLENTFNNILDEDNKDKIMNEFYKLTAFDIFTGQTDRGDTNLVIEEKTDTMLGPIFDNDCAFYDSYEYNSSFDNLYMPEMRYYGNIDKHNLYLFYLLLNNKVLLDYFTKSLDIDIKSIIKDMISKYYLELTSEDKRKINNFFDKRKRRMEYTLKLMNQYK